MSKLVMSTTDNQDDTEKTQEFDREFELVRVIRKAQQHYSELPPTVGGIDLGSAEG